MSWYVACLVVVEADDKVEDADDEEDLVGTVESPTYVEPNPVSIEWVEWS